MKIKILKKIIVRGNVKKAGDVIDSDSIPARDCAFLIKAKLAEKIVEKKSVETADTKPAVETADAAPKSKRGKNK